MAVSCISSDKTTGNYLVPSNQDFPVQMADIPLPVKVRAAEPMQSASSSQAVFGAIRTPEYGLVEFATMADICPNYEGWNTGEDLKVKEAYFMATVSNKYVIDEEQMGIPQIVTVHRTYRGIDSTALYNNSITEADYDPEPLNAAETVYFGGDTLKIHLKLSYAEELMSATQQERDSIELFMKRFKGLLFKTSTPDPGIYGGRENVMSFGTGMIYIRVNFQPTWEEGLDRKDTLFCVSFGYDYCVNLMKHESKSMETDTPQENLYIEGGAGLKPYINRNDLKDAIEAWKKENGLENKHLLVAKGALVFPFEIPEDNNMTKYPGNLFPAYQKIDTTYNAKYFYIHEDINVAGYSTGELNRSIEAHVMDIPSYIQDFVSLNKEELGEEYDLWMMPVFAQTDETYGNTTYSMDGITYYCGKICGPAAADSTKRPYLRLIYSVLD